MYEKFEGLDNRTYMYMEEEILFLNLKLNKLKMVYNPNIEIVHLEDAATNYVTQKSKYKRRFLYRNSLTSMDVIKSILLEE